jgi:flagellar hook assembly protein FlgD
MRFVLDLPRAGHVAVRVFDILGRAVGVVQDGSMDAGRHTLEWDATAYSGSRVASGVYFIVATDGEKSLIRRVVVG